MFYSTRYFIWLVVIAAVAVIIYERYDSYLLNFWRNLIFTMKRILPR
jgi:hypothetical protein